MAKYKVGYTTGTFDLFHAGHLNILREAKKQCEYLIVGVHSDEWVMHSKKRYPVISYEDRADIVGAIRYVDQVIMNDTWDKLKVWEKYKFDVVFTGDDYKGSDLWKKFEEDYNSVGVDVVYVPYTQRVSTTKIKETLKHPEEK